MSASAHLPLVFDAAAASDAELVDEVMDATSFLALGDDDKGIAPHTAADLRSRRLAAVLELARRWEGR